MTLTASVKPFKCNNPDHPKGCPFGSRWVECAEDEAIAWIAAITVGDRQVWSCGDDESQSRETATAALLNKLAEGVQP